MVCSIEIIALRLKQLALRSWNVVLVGTASGKLLHTLKDLFGVPESEPSKKEGEKIEASVHPANLADTPEEIAAMITEEPSTSAPEQPLKKRQVKEMLSAKTQFKDKYTNIKDASEYFCTSTIPMTMTGGDSSFVEKPDEEASVYRCTNCHHDSQQKVQAFAHVHRVHLGTCL